MKMSRLTITLLSSLGAFGSMVAYAGSAGTAMTASNFNDYLVFVQVGSNACGGQLIAGKYVVTAAHCLAENNLSNADLLALNNGELSSAQVSALQPHIVFGNPDRLTGVTYAANAGLIHAQYIAAQTTTTESAFAQQVAAEMESASGITASQLQYGDPAVLGDIAILTLASSAAQTSVGVLATSDSTLTDGQAITWAGWGATATDTAVQSVANTGTFAYVAYPHSNWWQMLGFIADNETGSTLNGSNTCAGDSGSPIAVNGSVLGYVRSSAGACGASTENSRYTAAWFYLNWIAEQVNAINTVSVAKLDASAAGVYTTTWAIPVQNLTTGAATFAPQIVDSTGLFVSDDLANCEGTFATGSTCTIHVTFNAGGSKLAASQAATLKLNDTTSIPLQFNLTGASSGGSGTTSGGSSTGGSTGGGSSGGGSADLLTLLGLGFVGLLRKRKVIA